MRISWLSLASNKMFVAGFHEMTGHLRSLTVDSAIASREQDADDLCGA